MIAAAAEASSFDHNATTPLCAAARAAVVDAWAHHGNPSAGHRGAGPARRRLALARAQLAGLLNAQPDALIFTSGGTEANNMAVKGAGWPPAAATQPAGKGHVLISAIEHASVVQAAAFLARRLGVELETVPCRRDGRVDPADVAARLRPDTRLLALMLANNETGALQPVEEIARLLRPLGVHLHVDAVQAVGKVSVDVQRLGCDSLALSGHKFGGPQGTGALWLRAGVELEPLLHGGGQEGGRRGGTEAVAALAGLGAAAEHARAVLAAQAQRQARQVQRLRQALLHDHPQAIFHGPVDSAWRLPNTLSVALPGLRAEALATWLDRTQQQHVGLGSACSALHSGQLSSVLLAMGVDEDSARATLRISLGPDTADAEVLQLAAALQAGAHRLRAVAGSA